MTDETPEELPDAAWAWILRAEGGEVDDPDDRGGYTRYGISQRAYPNEDIASLTKARARQLYCQDYWQRAGCDRLDDARLAVVHFDAAVNHGVGRAIRLLQEAAGVTVDGLIGPETLGAANGGDPRILIVELLGRRALFYHKIVSSDDSQGRFLRGWLLRTFRLQRHVYEEVRP